jgi:outer membrane protein OmpA-like peptidoglycan-associated protein
MARDKSRAKGSKQDGKPKREPSARPSARAAHGEVLGLQHSAGNEAVRGLLASGDERVQHDVDHVPAEVDAVLAAEGRPLDASVRAELEPLVGADLSDVRVHDDSAAGESADAVAARAYASGRHLVFGPSEYAPGTEEGRTLIAHEVGHAAAARQEGAQGAAAPVLRQPKDEPKAGLLAKSTVPAPLVSQIPGGTVATVYFAHNSFLMDIANASAVEKIGERLGFMAKPLVAVNGHASSEGPGPRNEGLARMRRDLVIAVLRSKAKGSFEIGGSGHGAAEPAVEENAKGADALEAQRAKNRRVEIIAVDLATPAPESKPEPKAADKPDITYHPKPEQETPEQEAKRNLDRMLKLGPIPERPKRSFSEEVWKAVDNAVDDITKKLGVPEKFRGMIKDGAHSAIEKGAEKALDTALDAAKVTGQERDAIKAAIKAAAQQKL